MDLCRHDIDPRWCSLCRREAGYRPGSDQQFNDCTVWTVVNLTGADYTEAAELLAAAGRKDGHGACATAVHQVLTDCGWTVSSTNLTVAEAMCRPGQYHVSARRGGVGHSFCIINGQAFNAGSYINCKQARVWAVN